VSRAQLRHAQQVPTWSARKGGHPRPPSAPPGEGEPDPGSGRRCDTKGCRRSSSVEIGGGARRPRSSCGSRAPAFSRRGSSPARKSRSLSLRAAIMDRSTPSSTTKWLNLRGDQSDAQGLGIAPDQLLQRLAPAARSVWGAAGWAIVGVQENRYDGNRAPPSCSGTSGARTNRHGLRSARPQPRTAEMSNSRSISLRSARAQAAGDRDTGVRFSSS